MGSHTLADRRDGLEAAPHGTARDYFASLREGFDAAVAARGIRTYELALAGAAVRLRFAGAALPPVVIRPLAQLPRPVGDDRAATACLWDSESTGIALPEPPWQRRDIDQRWEVHGFGDEGIQTQHDPEAGVLTMFEPATRTGIWWAPSVAAVPWYDQAAPLRTLLHWTVTVPGRHLLHAGAVAVANGAALLVGKGGSGKSTTAVLCLEAGFDYLGDDYVLLTVDPAPTVHSVYSTAKVTPYTVRRLPSLEAAVVARGRPFEKSVVDVAAYRPRRLRHSAPPAAVVVPTVTPGERTRLRPIAAAACLRALAPSTVLQLPHEGGRALSAMAELVRELPAYALDLGDDGADVPALLHPLLA